MIFKRRTFLNTATAKDGVHFCLHNFLNCIPNSLNCVDSAVRNQHIAGEKAWRVTSTGKNRKTWMLMHTRFPTREVMPHSAPIAGDIPDGEKILVRKTKNCMII